jgi:hypothetical protein
VGCDAVEVIARDLPKTPPTCIKQRLASRDPCAVASVLIAR